MLNFLIGILIGRESDSVATEVALQKGRDNPALKDRCYAAMATLFTSLLLAVIAMTMVFPAMSKLLCNCVFYYKNYRPFGLSYW